MKRDKILVIILCSIAQLKGYALSDDNKKPMYLKADSVEFNNTTHRGNYVGSVELDQGSTHLRAANVKTNANEKNQLTLAIAKGNKKAQAHYWTLPDNKKILMHAYADTIEYYPIKHQIKLIGHAKVQQDSDQIKAPLIIYDTIKQHVISKGNQYGRTTITVNRNKVTV